MMKGVKVICVLVMDGNWIFGDERDVVCIEVEI